MNKFAQRLTEYLNWKKIPHKKLAEDLGVSVRAVDRWCTGENEPTLDNLMRVCDILGESADYMLGRVDVAGKRE